MSVSFTTADPDALQKEIVARILQHGTPEWAVWDDELRFQLTGPEWATAYIRPMAEGERLILGLLPQEGAELSTELYAAYLGRLIEMLLRHCADLIGSEAIRKVFPLFADPY